jgi:hypothetical protein
MPDATGGAAPNAEEQDKALEDRLAKLLEKMLPGVVNSAVTSHTKRITKSFDEKLAALTAKPTTEVDGEEVLEVVDPKLAAQAAKAKLAAAAGEVIKPVDDPRLAALEKRLAQMTKESEAATKLAQTERRQRLENDGHGAVRKALTGKVIAGAEDDVLALFNGRKAITIGDDGAVRLRFGAKDEPEDGHDITEGVAAFLKTPGAAYFTPAPNGGAGGAKRGTQTGATTRTGPETVEAKFEAKHGKSIADVI